MKKIFIPLMGMVLLLSACSLDVKMITPVPVTEAPQASTPSSSVPVEAVSTKVETPQPAAFTPTTPNPVFYGAYVTSDLADTRAHAQFPAGSKQIFAVWNFNNMHAGLTVKREWYLNDQLWLTREEPWDFTKYGASGIMQDISIHDFDAGLSSGKYKLSVSIDNIAQPIGKKIPEGSADGFLEFEILPVIEAVSPSGQLKVTSLLDRLVLTDGQGKQSNLVSAHEIVSAAWLDDQHLLFVDRDRSGQVSDLPMGIRDELLIIDINTRETLSLYKGDSPLGPMGGLYVSPNGKYVAGIEGSGFGDACSLDSKVIFFEVASDHKSAKTSRQDQFAGVPISTTGTVYPTIVGTWTSNTQYTVYLNETCSTDRALAGNYVFDVPGLSAAFQPIDQKPSNAGDLGLGRVHGRITDGNTGAPVVGAVVSCEQHSYASTALCSGTTTTNADGVFVFDKIFFHDTDTIKLIIKYPGYQPKEVTQTSFTTPDMEANAYMSYPP